MHAETFGPVTPIPGIGFREQAVEVADDSRYGLSAYIFSRDHEAVKCAVDAQRFGEIYINRAPGESVHAHRSGGMSGIGGEAGKTGLLRYTQIKTADHITKSAEATPGTQLSPYNATGSRRAPAYHGRCDRAAHVADRTTCPA